jgi:hypothetical protein
MNDDRDPTLEALFAEPVDLPADEDFSVRVMQAVRRHSRRRRALRLTLEVGILLLAWLLAAPLQGLVETLLPWIMNSLVDLGEGRLAVLIEPVNNLASVLALSYLLGRSVVKRLIL